MKFCPNCGAKIEDDDVFCTNCGTQIGNVAPQVKPQRKSVNLSQHVKIKKRPLKSSTLNKAPITVGNKKFSPKFLIIAIVVILAIGGFGFYKYHTNPAHNSSNPLANQTIMFKTYSSFDQYITEDSQDRIFDNCFKKMYASCHFNPKVADIINSDNITDLLENSEKEVELDKELSGNINASERKKLDTLAEDCESIKKTGPAGRFVKISPAGEMKNGEKVTLKLMIKPSIAKKYGIDLTPRKVTVQGLSD